MRTFLWIWAAGAAIACSTVHAQNFGGEVGRWRVTGTQSADTFGLTQGVPAGTRAVITLGWEATSSMALSSIVDSKGNTWTVHVTKFINSVHQCAVASANVVNSLAAGDSVTINWTAGQSADRSAMLLYVKNVPDGSPLVQNSFNSYGTAVSAPITLSDSNAFVVGLVQIEQNATYSGSAGTPVGARVTYGDSSTTVGLCNYVFYKDGPFSTGKFDPLGTISVNKSYVVLQVAFKVGAVAQQVAPPSNLRILSGS